MHPLYRCPHPERNSTLYCAACHSSFPVPAAAKKSSGKIEYREQPAFDARQHAIVRLRGKPYKEKMQKYGNKKTEYNGRIFMSKKEAQFAQQLDLLRSAKDKGHRVKDIEYQPKFPIVLKDKKVCTYIADFRVFYEDGREEIIDVKGFKTAIYRLKKKLVEAVYGIVIVEV